MSADAPTTPNPAHLHSDETMVEPGSNNTPHTTPRRSQVSTQHSPDGPEKEEEPESLQSSKSLGLDAAEFKALYPSINKDVGFDNTQVPQDMIELIKSIKVKIPPANPSQVKRDKKSVPVDMEDDFSKEKYSHSTSNHTTFVQGLTRIPFNIFECQPFLDFVKASGLDFAAKWPSLSELQEKLDDLKTDYPGFLSRANAKHAELSVALGKKKIKKSRGTRKSTRSKKGKGKEKEKEQEKGKEDEEKDKAEVVDEGSNEEGSQASEAIPKESKQSLANIWRHPLESWQVSFPILDPAPKVSSNRAANNAASKARAEAARLANASSSKTASSSANRKARLSIPLPPGFIVPQSPAPAPDTDDRDPQVVPIYGCDAKSLPPPVVHFYALALRPVYAAFANALESIAGEKGELNALTSGEERAFQVRENHKRYPYLVTIETEKAAFRAVFGDWAVRESFGKFLWAERPPTATSPVDGYAEALSMVNTAFRSSFKARDDARYDAILKLDTEAMSIIPTFEAPSFILDMTRQDVRAWLETMITIELRYLHLRATPIPRFVDVMSAFLKKCSNYDLLSNEEWNLMDNDERERVWAIRQGIDALEQERKEISENSALDTGFSSFNFANAANADIENAIDDAVEIDDLLPESDYGIEVFKGQDGWDLAGVFGIIDLQDETQRELAESMTREEAHRRVLNSEGQPTKNDEGDWIWKNPKVHLARTNIRFPGLNVLDSEPKDRNDWDQYVDKCVKEGETPIRTTGTHQPIFPSIHQLMGVANIMARGYLDPKYAPYHSHTLLQDDVGVGKTLQFLMVITLLDYYRKAPEMTPETCPPIMLPWKKQWSIGRKVDDSEELEDLDEAFIKDNLTVQWIGDRILKQYTRSDRHRKHFTTKSPITPSLILASPTIQQSHLSEFTRFLDQSRFVCMPFPKGFRNKPSIQREFVEAVEAKTAANLHVIISMTYEEATYVSQKVTVDHDIDDRARSDYKDQIRQSTILKTEWLFDVLVMDEVHVLRNRESDRCKAIQRLSRKGLTVIGATATALYNSPMDIIGEAAAMCHGKVVSSAEQKLAAAGNPFAWIDGVDDTWNEIKAIRAKTERSVSRSKAKRPSQELDTAQGKLAAEADLLARQARWLGPMEDEGSVEGMELETLRIRNSFRSKLKTGVAQPILYHLQQFILRRTKASKDLHGDPIVELPPSTVQHISITLSPREQVAYNHWANQLSDDKSPKASNFQILARKYNLDPHFATTGWYNPTIPPSRKMRSIIKACREWDEGNFVDDADDQSRKSDTQQTKLVIHTLWTSQVQVLQARLAKAGFFCKTLSGDTPQALRQGIISDFQRDEDHMSDPIAYYDADNELVLFKSVPCRILIITSVGSSGITLHRANTMFMIDKFFTHQEYLQTEGRIIRKGQTRACFIKTFSVENTCDEWMASLAGSKGMAASTLFGRGAKTARLLEEGEDPIPGQDVLEIPADAKEALDRLEKKEGEDAKKRRDVAMERRLAPPQKPVSSKEEDKSAGGSGKRKGSEGGEGEKKKAKKADQATKEDLIRKDAEMDKEDLAAQEEDEWL